MSKIKFEIYNKSYDEVKIKTPPKDTIIYIDPPYKGTADKGYNPTIKKVIGKERYYSNKSKRYYEKTKVEHFDYDILYDWCHKMAQKGYKVFMSEYNCDSPYVEEKFSIKKRSNFCPNKVGNQRVERLYLWH